MQEDTYKTIQESAEAIYTEKRSKFIAIALPVRTLSEVKSLLEEYQKKYYDARHVCYAYMLGALVIVVRYFGGIKLGTSGLIVAYRMAASLALDEAPVIEKTVDEDVAVAFEYPFMNDIMRIVKEESPEILEQSYDMDCLMRLRIRKSMMGKLRARLEKVETARILDE